MGEAGYIRKLPEEGTWKRFYIVNVPEMIEFLKSIGAEEVSEEQAEPVIQKVIEPFKPEEYSGNKSFTKLLGEVENKLNIIWGDELSRSGMSNDFKKRWRELEIKYRRYTKEDFHKEIEVKNERKRKE